LYKGFWKNFDCFKIKNHFNFQAITQLCTKMQQRKSAKK